MMIRFEPKRVPTSRRALGVLRLYLDQNGYLARLASESGCRLIAKSDARCRHRQKVEYGKVVLRSFS